MSSSWCDPQPEKPLPFWENFRLDALAYLADPPAHVRTSRTWSGSMVWMALRSAGLHLVALYRLSHTVRARGGLAGRILADALVWWGRHLYGCTLAPTARLHGGLVLPHPQGIVIGPGVVVGPRSWIFQNVTIGGAPGKVGFPRVGADSRIYSGAVLTGPIAVGDNVMVGANAVVHRDVPDRSLVRSAPVEVGPLPDAFRASPPPSEPRTE
jgi:serine O-acetyltransferase